MIHDAAGDHAVSLEGSASLPWLSPDGKRLYYLLRKNTSSDLRELWRRDLQSGKSDPPDRRFQNALDVTRRRRIS